MIDLSNRYGEALKRRYRAFTKGSKNGTLYQPCDVARKSRERPENDYDEERICDGELLRPVRREIPVAGGMA